MRFFKNGYNGGWEIFTRNGRGGFKMGDGKVSLHSWQKVMNPPILGRPHYIAYRLFQLLSTPLIPCNL